MRFGDFSQPFIDTRKISRPNMTGMEWKMEILNFYNES